MSNFRRLLFFLSLFTVFSGHLSAEFSANVTEAPVGSSVTLTWSSPVGNSCSAFGEWSGTKSGSGSEQVTVPSLEWNMYGLSCNFNFEYVWVWGTEASTTPTNSAPTINGLPNSISVAENQTTVTTVSASDSDGDALTYSLSGTDASSLSISSSGVITFNSAPDYETKNSYFITVNVSDGNFTTSKALTITITDVDEGGGNSGPVISGLPFSISVAENQTAVTTVSASDADGDALTYSISGTDAGALSISSSGVLTFNSAPDYETKDSYSITVKVSDVNGNSHSRTLTINITDVDESSGSSSITVSSGAEVSLAFKTAPDYENPQDANQDNYYKVTVNVSDGQQTISREITVRIDDVQD